MQSKKLPDIFNSSFKRYLLFFFFSWVRVNQVCNPSSGYLPSFLLTASKTVFIFTHRFLCMGEDFGC